MGFFSGVRRRIKKLIPKEVRPYVPYIAAAIPGMGPFSATALKGYGAAANSFLTAAAAKGLSDDEADLKDILRTGTLAAAPQAIGQGLGQFGEKFGNAPMEGMGNRGILETLGNAATKGSKSNYLNPDFSKQFGDTAKTVALQGATDYGLKAAELNEDALAKYNADLARQGINDKAGRRAAIRAIYSNTGTWDMDEVDSMLDTYGYRTGGRVGYAEGDMVLTEKSTVTPEQRNQIEGNKMAEEAINDILYRFYEKFPGVDASSMSIEDIVAELQAEKVFEQEGLGILGLDRSMDMITPESVGRSTQRIMRGDTQYGDIGSMKEQPETEYERRVKAALGYNMGGRVGLKDGGFDMEAFQEGFKYAKEGLESLEEAEDEIKPLPIRELRLADGGRVSELKAAYQRYLEMARKDGSKKIIPFEIFAEEFARENFARGGITDINMEEQIDTPSGDMMMDENVEVASNPEVMDSLNELSLMLFRKPLDQLSDEEYDDLQDFAGQQALKPGLIDEYRNYKYNAEEQGQTPMSPRDYFRMEFGAARLGVKKGGPIELNINVGGNNMEDIKGQTAGPDWYYDRMRALEFEFGDELTEEEIADIAYDNDKFYDKMGYDPGDYKKGGKVIELMPKGILYKGKAKDYPGIKQLIKDMKKKGTRPKKAEGGPMYSEEDFPILLDPKRKDGRKPSLYDYDGQYDNYDDEVIEIPMGGKMKKMKKKRKNKAEGGLMSMGGNEMDLRGGGFVPMGAKERADDVPARLSKNEFVMTADAVRGAGGGSVQKGADLMYDQMKRLEGQA